MLGLENNCTRIGSNIYENIFTPFGFFVWVDLLCFKRKIKITFNNMKIFVCIIADIINVIKLDA